MQTNSLIISNQIIPTKDIGGVRIVAIRPLCNLLGLHAKHHLDSISNDDIFGELSCVYRMVAADGKERNMLCMALGDAMMWVISIEDKKAKNPNFPKKKKACYFALRDYIAGKGSDTFELTKQENELIGTIQFLEDRVRKDQKNIRNFRSQLLINRMERISLLKLPVFDKNDPELPEDIREALNPGEEPILIE